MIIGSGLLASAFSHIFSDNREVCIYAAGVSNSSCSDINEFRREKLRLKDALLSFKNVKCFVYFSTCSIYDEFAINTPYVQHKLVMEELVKEHNSYLIFRLPQVAGETPNPHTLLNYLYARIIRSESFQLWCNARRNIIDVDDVVAIVSEVIFNSNAHNSIHNIANRSSYGMLEIVHAIELCVGKSAVFEAIEKGGGYDIDISSVGPILKTLGIRFDGDYLHKVINKYYG